MIHSFSYAKNNFHSKITSGGQQTISVVRGETQSEQTDFNEGHINPGNKCYLDSGNCDMRKEWTLVLFPRRGATKS